MSCARELFFKFVKDNYPLPVPEGATDCKEKIRDMKRLVWYENTNGNIIPDLQDLNTYSGELEIKENTSNCGELYAKGLYHYRVFPCTHAFLDVTILATIFDNIGYPEFMMNNVTPEKFTEKLRVFDSCPMCNCDVLDEKLKPYYIGRGYMPNYSATKIATPYLPKFMLPTLDDLLEKGDVIDTRGYRALGYYIHNGSYMEQVETKEYYPIWRIEYLLERGYLYYLQRSQGYIDGLEFKNGIFWNSYVGFYCDNDEIKKKYNSDTFPNNLKYDEEDETYIVPYPFESVSQANFYLKYNDNKLKCQITDDEWLYFDIDSRLYIADSNREGYKVLPKW